MFDALLVALRCSDGEDDASEDLDAALRKLQAFTAKVGPGEHHPRGTLLWLPSHSSNCSSSPLCWVQETGTPRARPQEVQPGQVIKKPEVIDDFLRNFFIKMGLSRTCECFEAEWYELKVTGRLDNTTTVPDVYMRNAVSAVSISPQSLDHKGTVYLGRGNSRMTIWKGLSCNAGW